MATAHSVLRHGLQMRSNFDFSKLQLRSWFPRHMAVGMMQMQGKLHSIDAVIEVHDARIPFTGRNFNLSDIGILKPSILVLNKVDLVAPERRERVASRFNDMGHEVLFTNSKEPSDRGVECIVEKVLHKIKNSNRYNRSEFPEINLMILGIPNVGKSSLINSLRNRNMHRKKAAAVAPRPGVTRCVMERIQVYIRDTPGVLAPSIPSAEAGLKLALAATVDDRLVGAELLADYLLFR
ncbi:hypothetical protein HAZT_HAZT007526 [Hyalella azteca]|uniref:G domain-containing protein n=1 Tax=Hyalella azteca TaxID=294128 RepID=A0A6A0H7F2_HYAAZ|nr:hypothetical protein HAZT_HAZT007526 [Hyalella azteca]